MEATPSFRARPMAELLPELSDGILSKECIRFLTAQKTHQETVATRNVRSSMKPLTLAQMRNELLALQVVQNSPRRATQVNRSARKKAWNSSVKVEKKTISHTEKNQLQKNPVRKVLDFQPPTIHVNSRATGAFDSTKFREPESKDMKTIALQGRQDPRISGICKISETPVVTKQIKSRMTIANKENFPSSKKVCIKKSLPSNAINHKKLEVATAAIPGTPISNECLMSRMTIANKKIFPSSKKVCIKEPLPSNANNHKKLEVATAAIPDTPMSNESWKSSCDASFLQAEKEINDIEEKTKALAEEQTLDKLDDITPPASTPFIGNKSIKDFFNNPCDSNSSVMDHDDTIMNFDNSGKDLKRDDSVIVSLCSLLNKATVKSPENSSEFDYLLQIEKLIEQDTNTIDNTIDTLNKMKDTHLKALQYLKLIREKKSPRKDLDKTLTKMKDTIKDIKMGNSNPTIQSSDRGSIARSVIVSPRSPSYKIPKKSIPLQKKVVCKSMPNITSNMITPVKGDMGIRALSMYMKMKQHMNFLNTPVTKRNVCAMDTPAVTSHNLRNQLDKLYDED